MRSYNVDCSRVDMQYKRKICSVHESSITLGPAD